MGKINHKIINYYKVLGIDETSSTEEIRKAYLKLAKRYHPDRNNDDEISLVKFTLINEAYSILGNLENRLQHRIELQKREHIHEQAKIKMRMKKKSEENDTKYKKSNKK